MKRAFDGKPALRDASRRKDGANDSQGEPKTCSSVGSALDGPSQRRDSSMKGPKTGDDDGAKATAEKKDDIGSLPKPVIPLVDRSSMIIIPPSVRTDVSPQDETMTVVKKRILAYGDPVLVRLRDNRVVSRQPVCEYIHLETLIKKKD